MFMPMARATPYQGLNWVVDGPEAPVARFSPIVAALTASGTASARAYQIQPTRHLIRRAPMSRRPATPSRMNATMRAAMSAPGAGLNLDGSILPPASDRGAVTCRPFLQIGGAYHTRTLDPTWASYWENLQGWRRELHIEGVLHNDFTDIGVLLDQFGLDRHLYGDFGPIEPIRALKIQHTYVRAFFTETLLNRHQRLLDGPSTEFPEITFTP